MKHQDGVITNNAVIVWDGFTTPEEKQGDKGKYLQYTISIVLPATDPCVAELQEILTNELNTGMFKGKFPSGAHWGIKQQDPTAYEGRFPNHVIIKGVTYNVCQVYDAGNNILDPMVYKSQLFSGCVVNLFVTPRSYDTVSKGCGFWLSGIRIIDPTAPRIAGVGANAGAAFGAAPVTGAPVAAAIGAPGQQQAAPQVPGQYPAGPAAAGPPVIGAPGGSAAAYGPGGPAVTVHTPGVVPNPGIMTVPVVPVVPVHQMLPAAGGNTYETMLANGWTDALLVQHGMMVG